MVNMSWNEILSMIVRMLGASVTTLQLFFFTLLFALPLGMLLAVGRMSRIKPLSWVIRAYLLVMRGTPLMLQLIFFWFFLPLQSRLMAAIITFSLNSRRLFRRNLSGRHRGSAGGPAGSG